MSQPPPGAGVHMPAVASAVGVAVDAVDAGGREGVFSRPEEAVQPHGPIANSLAGRMSGSSAAVDAAGAGATHAGDAVVDDRVTSGPA